jgi:hypothetical protein
LSSTIKESKEEVVIAVDSSGVKVTNRGEWMREKWDKRRGWIKVHIGVNTKTKEIVGLEVTDERTGDSKVLPSNLIEKISHVFLLKRFFGRVNAFAIQCIETKGVYLFLLLSILLYSKFTK